MLVPVLMVDPNNNKQTNKAVKQLVVTHTLSSSAGKALLNRTGTLFAFQQCYRHHIYFLRKFSCLRTELNNACQKL